ncbi:ImmA/IrrE family metallo-endopeptidase [uncultured Maritimibacter sp.]|uniref:ImmA/IrrE family metallo-endopeptidase n=1 Tax=uncultured Maritimibacter sp. TaxID=991866 RepID=UPI0030DBCFFB
MALDRIDLADIHAPDRLATRLHAQLGPVTSAVPIVEIALGLDISDVRIDNFDGFEGMLLTDRVRSDGVILANCRHGDQRARFTIAHELGHFLLERHEVSSETGFRCTTRDMRETREGRRELRQEAEANRFAIERLAPSSLVERHLSRDPDLCDVQHLRRALDLSGAACIRRMVERRDELLAAIWSHAGRIRYSIQGDGFPYLALKKNDPLPKISQAFDVVSKGDRCITTFRETHAAAWTRRPEIELFEQTRVGRDRHAVTLLWADLSPEADDEDDGALPELGEPGFR